jgi:hypothetical protein
MNRGPQQRLKTAGIVLRYQTRHQKRPTFFTVEIFSMKTQVFHDPMPASKGGSHGPESQKARGFFSLHFD